VLKPDRLNPAPRKETSMAEDEVLANQRRIVANQEQIIELLQRIESNQGKLDQVVANQEKILGNQNTIVSKVG
jgi:hypothetical protein